MRSLTISCLQSLVSQQSAGYIQLYLGEHLKQDPILLISNFSAEVTHNQCLCTRNFPLEDTIHFLQTLKEAKIYCPFKVLCTIGLYHTFRS